MSDFKQFFESAPDAYLVLAPAPPFTILAVNDAYLRLTDTRRENLVGREVFEVFAGRPAELGSDRTRSLRTSLELAASTGLPQVLPRQRYQFPLRPAGNEALEPRYWRLHNTPVFGPDRVLRAIIHRIEDITAVVQLEESEQRLREAALRLDAAATIGEIGTWIWEPQTDRLFADEKVARWYHVPAEAARGGSLHAYLEAVHPDDLPAVREAILRSTRDEPHFEARYRIRNGSGASWRWVLTRARIERDAQNQPVRLVGAVLDITDLQQTRAALTATEAQLRLAADAAEIGSFSWTVPPGELVWDARCKAHFWLPPDAEVNFQRFYSIVHPDDRERVRAAIDTTVRERSDFDVEYRTVSPGGEIRWVHAKGRTFSDEARLATRFDGITLDVTRQKQTEADLVASEARYRLVVSSLRDHAIFLLDHEGRITHWNAGAQRLLGYTESEVLGRWAGLFFTPEDRARGEPERELSTAKEKGSATDDRWHMRKDGSRFFVTGLMSALTDPDGRRIGFAKIMRDITERQAAAAERERLLERERAARTEAERTSRLKDDFLATLSHELRTPLNAILGWTQILQSGDLEPNDLEQGLDVIERNTRIQVKLIEDLLDMSRIISGKVRLDVQNVPVANVVNAAIDSVRTAAEAKDIRLGAVYHGAGATILGDSNRLQQVVWNLLSNAIKFTPRGGRVQVSVTREETSVAISVSDNGSGIRPEFLPHVFERFRQADASTTRQYGGLGLGLSIVKQLVELHGGQVAASSEGEGRGATFTVTLPVGLRRVPDAPAIPRPRPPAPTTLPDVDLEGIRVLVVDDEEDSVRLVGRVLADRGAEVKTAASMAEALEVLESFRPDVLLSDIGMPRHDGYELIRRVRARPESARIPAAALTALARSEDRARALEAGFHTHVAKPVEPAELLRVVATLAFRQPAT